MQAPLKTKPLSRNKKTLNLTQYKFIDNQTKHKYLSSLFCFLKDTHIKYKVSPFRNRKPLNDRRNLKSTGRSL